MRIADQAREQIACSRNSLAKIGDGDWTPQDTEHSRLAQVSEELVALLEAEREQADQRHAAYVRNINNEYRLRLAAEAEVSRLREPLTEIAVDVVLADGLDDGAQVHALWGVVRRHTAIAKAALEGLGGGETGAQPTDAAHTTRGGGATDSPQSAVVRDPEAEPAKPTKPGECNCDGRHTWFPLTDGRQNEGHNVACPAHPYNWSPAEPAKKENAT